MGRAPVITVDGPSGTGKGTVCQFLARWLDWHLLDSGALYRALAYALDSTGIVASNREAVSKLAEQLEVSFKNSPEHNEIKVFFSDQDISRVIRTEACGRVASEIAAYPEVRAALLARQRRFCQPPGLIADGRDMGTVVFPAAELKVFLTASPAERAQRRYKQLIEKGNDVNLARLSADISERDGRDREREASPLRPARGAVVIDTTGQPIDAVTGKVSTLVREVFPGVPEQVFSNRQPR